MGQDSRRLTAAELDTYLQRLSPLREEIVLIGGQALNLWTEHYATAPGIAEKRPFTSKDVDFCGTHEHATRTAQLLGGECSATLAWSSGIYTRLICSMRSLSMSASESITFENAYRDCSNN